ncbi:hypothetical protein BaRGS_00016109 [Batillaria attramentaria]|uniref:GH10 domain-containing protein n=1 Tax=Batillaria attramentaria TaxID=370345 RepID=A0ABD0KZV1_9CAEN
MNSVGTIFLGFLLLVTWRPSTGQQTNLLANPSFEDDLQGNWKLWGGNMERVYDPQDSRHGDYVAKCSQRTKDYQGPTMLDVPVQPGGRYAFQGYVKLTNSSQSTKIWQLFKAVMIFEYADGMFASAKFSVRGPDPGVDFLVDDFSLFEVAENTTWRADSYSNIENYRKSDVTFSVTLPTGVQPSEIDLQIDLKKHLFGFGTLVKDIRIKQQPTNAYSKLVFNLFNWATVQTYKWKLQKGNETHPDFSSALEVTDILNSNGLKVRGHSIFWNVEDNIPDWVKAKTNAELPQVLFSHLDYIVNVSLGKLAHWDVQNEHIYSHYLEERLGPAYANLTKDFFRSVKELDPVTKLYYNDFTGVTSGSHTQVTSPRVDDVQWFSVL